MRIGQISIAYQPINGGQEVYIDQLLKVFRETGIDSRVYQTKRRGKFLNTQMVTRIPFLHRLFPHIDQHIFNLFLFLFFQNKLRSEDIIICHYALHSLPVWKFKEKTIVLSHGIEWYPEENSFNTKIKEKIYKKALDRFITVANDTNYYRHFGIDIKPGENFFEEVAPNKWFIPNCVDTTYFKRTEGLPELKNKNIVFVPRQIVPDRGIHIAIEAFYFFQKEYKDFYLHIAGAPLKGKYYEYCLSLIDKCSLHDKVKFLGRIDREKLPDYYSSAKLCLIPTVRREGTSLSALESMACGTATISTNVAGLRDLPTVQAEPYPEAIFEAMKDTLTSLEKIGEEQHKEVKEVFNQVNWSKAWLKVINSFHTVQ